MITYTATGTESEGWWTLQCVEVPGAISQVRELHQAESMIREAIAFVLGHLRRRSIWPPSRSAGIAPGTRYLDDLYCRDGIAGTAARADSQLSGFHTCGGSSDAQTRLPTHVLSLQTPDSAGR